MNAGGRIKLDIAEQREQARVSRAITAERAMWMKPQHLVDAGREHSEIKLAGFGEVTFSQRVGDRRAVVPEFEPTFEGLNGGLRGLCERGIVEV